MLNSTKHEISNTYKSKNEENQEFFAFKFSIVVYIYHANNMLKFKQLLPYNIYEYDKGVGALRGYFGPL